jgi:hypothetical protein
MPLFYRYIFLFFFFFIVATSQGQQLVTKRPTFYALLGTSGGKLNQFDKLLLDRGLSGLRNRYQTIGVGYQTRINDFVLGMDILHNRGGVSKLDDYRMNYRTSRALLNIGYAFTEESRFQLIHYMSLGVGFLNFQMLPSQHPEKLDSFLATTEKRYSKGDFQLW